MCFHSKQSKAAIEVENRFKAKIDKIALFQPKENINGFDFALNPIITDEQPRYRDAKDQYKTQQQIKEDLSSTQRAPYPQAHEINLPRHRITS